MPNAMEIKKRLNAIAEAACKSFNSHKTKKDKGGTVVENNYSFAAAAKAMVQEAFDLGRGTVKSNVEEPIVVDQEDEGAAKDAPQVPLEIPAPEAPSDP